jgi:hypothetical protein
MTDICDLEVDEDACNSYAMTGLNENMNIKSASMYQ